MTINELIKYYEWRLDQTKDFSDPHWEASERREQDLIQREDVDTMVHWFIEEKEEI